MSRQFSGFPCGASSSQQALGAEPVSDLIVPLKSNDVAVRRDAVRKLSDYGAPAVDAVPALTNALDDDDRNVRTWAIIALSKVGPSAKKAVTALTDVLKNDELEYRGRAKQRRRVRSP